MNDSDVRKRMGEAVEAVKTDLASIRTGRATPAIVQDIQVTSYGGTQRLKIIELGTIIAPDSRTLTITPWDKSTIFDIKRGIEEAKIGVNPTVDNDLVRISLPPMTSEDRQSYTRLLHQKLENGKVVVRRVRQEAMEEIDSAFRDKQFGEDDKFRREEQVQKLTDEHVGKIEELGKQKETDLSQI